MTDISDSSFMRQALELAERGRGQVSPNPLVGAVVVRDGVVIGRGWHQRAGTEHAEIHALREAGEAARGATLYVTLEPCCHHGKTPPCTDAIRASGITRVVAAITDPNPLVCGEGASCLSGDGIDITVGVLADDAKKQNEVFLKYISSDMPFVTVKLAATLDGYSAAPDGSSKWITGPDARKEVHRMRAWSDAVLVGAGTVLADNPHLTVRDAEGNDPLRIIIDPDLATPPDAAVVNDGTMFFVQAPHADSIKAEHFRASGVTIVPVSGEHDTFSLKYVLQHIAGLDITSVLCEGGPTLATSLFAEQLVDKIVYMVAPKLLGGGIRTLDNLGIEHIGGALKLDDVSYAQLGGDMMITGYPIY